MRDNCEIVDATLQAATDIQTNVQTYVTDKLSTPPPSLAGGLRHGLTLGMLATETNVTADDEGSVVSSPGEVTPADFGLDSRDVVMVTSQEETRVDADDFNRVSPSDVTLVTPDDVMVTPEAYASLVTPDVSLITPDVSLVTPEADVTMETDIGTEEATNGASVELLNFVPEDFPPKVQA